MTPGDRWRDSLLMAFASCCWLSPLPPDWVARVYGLDTRREPSGVAVLDPTGGVGNVVDVLGAGGMVGPGDVAGLVGVVGPGDVAGLVGVVGPGDVAGLTGVVGVVGDPGASGLVGVVGDPGATGLPPPDSGRSRNRTGRRWGLRRTTPATADL